MKHLLRFVSLPLRLFDLVASRLVEPPVARPPTREELRRLSDFYTDGPY